MATIATLVVLIRLYSRTFVKRVIGSDDLTMGAAMARLPCPGYPAYGIFLIIVRYSCLQLLSSHFIAMERVLELGNGCMM